MKVVSRSMLNGFMVIWDKVDEAARYNIHLYVVEFVKDIKYNNHSNPHYWSPKNAKEIEIVEVDRNKLYHSFVNMAELTIINENDLQNAIPMNYYVKVEAEDKNGDIIDMSDSMVCLVKKASNGYSGDLIISDEIKWGR